VFFVFVLTMVTERDFFGLNQNRCDAIFSGAEIQTWALTVHRPYGDHRMEDKRFFKNG
jgi:hypothetical protein